MATSIDNYLRTISYEKYYLKNSSTEVAAINTSINNLLSNLNEFIGSRINRTLIFGSFDRDTILPRAVDKNSDVDIMVVFNHTEHERTPETYRAWLKSFADKYYANRYGSAVLKTFPTVTIRLTNIHYDLVPAKVETYSFLPSTTYIPDKGNSWRPTNPKDVKDDLTAANTKYNSIVRPIIRIMKAWNAFNDYPYDSYELEKEIIGMYFGGDTVQSGFFYASRSLNTSWSDPVSKTEKINSLKFNLSKVEECLNNNDVDRAKHWLHRIIPI